MMSLRGSLIGSFHYLPDPLRLHLTKARKLIIIVLLYFAGKGGGGEGRGMLTCHVISRPRDLAMGIIRSHFQFTQATGRFKMA